MHRRWRRRLIPQGRNGQKSGIDDAKREDEERKTTGYLSQHTGRLARLTAELLTIEANLSKRGVGPIVLSMAETINKMRANGASPMAIARELGIARSSVYRMLDGAAPMAVG